MNLVNLVTGQVELTKKNSVFKAFSEKQIFLIPPRFFRMSSGSSNDSIFEELSINKDLVKYCTFMPRRKNKDTGLPELSDEKVTEMHLEQLSSLTSFLNYTLIGKPLKRSRITPHISYTNGLTNIVYHVLLFIEDLEYEILKEQREKNISFVGKVIEFLEKHKPDGGSVILYVDDAQLFTDIRQVPTKIKQLKKYYNKQMQKLTLLCPPPANEMTIKLELSGIIEAVTNTIDVNTSYFPVSYLQTSFERLINHEYLPFKQVIEDIVKSFNVVSPADFTDNIFNLCVQIIKTLNLNKRYSDSAVSFLLYRYIFDEVYPVNGYLNKSDANVNPFPKVSEITNEELQLPLGFCPPDLDVSLKPRDVFRKDPYFSEAVSKYEEIEFFCNPFDIIAVIMQSINLIEKAASQYDKDKTLVFPFEVTFGLFLAVVLSSSSFYNISSIAKFVDLYTPQAGMCPAFDYARAKILACAAELEEMEQGMN